MGVGYWLGVVVVTCIVGCGASTRSEPAQGGRGGSGGREIETAGGGATSGGASGAGGSGNAGGGGAPGGTGANSGAAGEPASLHDCAAVAAEPRCPDRVLVRHVRPGDEPELDPALLDGVTDLDGELIIEDQNSSVLDHLGCLRRVNGRIDISSDAVASLWAFRHVEEVAYGTSGAGLRIRAENARQDCGFLELRVLGVEATGFVGGGIDVEGTALTELALPALEHFDHLRVSDNAALATILFQDGVEFLDGQLWILDNPELREVTGLESLAYRAQDRSHGPLPQFQLAGNTSFPTCVFEALRDRLIAGGAEASGFEIADNSESCPR